MAARRDLAQTTASYWPIPLAIADEHVRLVAPQSTEADEELGS